MRLEETPLSVRAINGLSKAGFDTVEKCLSLTKDELFKIPSLGEKTVEEILHYFDAYQLPPITFSDERLEYLASVLSIPITDITLPKRAANTLSKLGVMHLIDLMSLSSAILFQTKNIGRKTLSELENILSELGLNLGLDLTPQVEMEINRRIIIDRTPGAAIKKFKKHFPEKAKILEEITREIISKDKITFYMRCYELHKRGGTLGYVAKQVGLTRERIRQILIKGTKLNLFQYKNGYSSGSDHYISKAQLIDSIILYKTSRKIAEANKIELDYLKGMLFSYNISKQKFNELVLKGKKNEEIKLYLEIKKEVGHDLTTTELQSKPEWRALEGKIRRHWGSIDKFREELGIPKSLH